MKAARQVYLDYNATTPLAPEALQAMMPYLTEEYGNASSIHSAGQRARAGVEQAREQVAALIVAREREIVFTGGGTEADNLAIRGVVQASPRERKHIITTTVEHHAVLNTCQALESEGVEVTYLPVGADGLLDPQAVQRAITPDTVLITVMFANNELGTIQPIGEIARVAQERKILDLLALSGHKFYGPKGVGALYVRRGVRLKPLFFGGHHERDRRPGTENVAGIVGLGAAAERARNHLTEEGRRLAGLRDELERRILERVPHAGVNGDRKYRTPNTTNLYFDFVEGEPLVISMDLKGIACSTGAACSSGAVEPSHVLTAIGLSAERARASLRFSLGRNTTQEDIDYVTEVIPSVVEHLRELSPRYKKPAASTAD
jgi:cysteine desulfurase